MQKYQPQQLQWTAPAHQSGRVPSHRELSFRSADDRGEVPKISRKMHAVKLEMQSLGPIAYQSIYPTSTLWN